MTDSALPTHPDVDASPAALWQAWLAVTAAYHVATATDPQSALRALDDAEILALRLAASPAATLDDTKPKTIMAAWHREYGVSMDVDRALEAAIADDLLRLQPPLDIEIDGPALAGHIGRHRRPQGSH